MRQSDPTFGAQMEACARTPARVFIANRSPAALSSLGELGGTGRRRQLRRRSLRAVRQCPTFIGTFEGLHRADRRSRLETTRSACSSCASTPRRSTSTTPTPAWSSRLNRVAAPGPFALAFDPFNFEDLAARDESSRRHASSDRWPSQLSLRLSRQLHGILHSSDRPRQFAHGQVHVRAPGVHARCADASEGHAVSRLVQQEDAGRDSRRWQRPLLLGTLGARSARAPHCSRAAPRARRRQPVRTFELPQPGRCSMHASARPGDRRDHHADSPAGERSARPFRSTSTERRCRTISTVSSRSSGRGELAVVDLTQGTVIDVDQATPGFNFHVVGKNPTDVAVTPDGLMTFVAAAEVNKPAIYALRNDQILGDWPGVLGVKRRRTAVQHERDQLARLRASASTGCARDRPPEAGRLECGRRRIRLRNGRNERADHNGRWRHERRPRPIGRLRDPRRACPVTRAIPRSSSRSIRSRSCAAQACLTGAGATIAKASLAPCPITSAVELAGGAYVPSQVQPGTRMGRWNQIRRRWRARGASTCYGRQRFVRRDSASRRTQAFRSMRRRDRRAARWVDRARWSDILYVADNALPIIHVIDLRSGSANELPPLVLTSIAEPDAARDRLEHRG